MLPRLRADQTEPEEVETFPQNTLTISRRKLLLHIKAAALISCRETRLSRSWICPLSSVLGRRPDGDSLIPETLSVPSSDRFFIESSLTRTLTSFLGRFAAAGLCP